MDKDFEKYYNDINEIINQLKNKQLEYPELLDKVKENYINVKEKVDDYEKVKIGYDNTEKATLYSEYYTYKATKEEFLITEKLNYEFILNNRYLSRLFNKPHNRIKIEKNSHVYNKINIEFTPKCDKKIIDGKIYLFTPFSMVFNTKKCYKLHYISFEKYDKEYLLSNYMLDRDKLDKYFNKFMKRYNFNDKIRDEIYNLINRYLRKPNDIFIKENPEYKCFKSKDENIPSEIMININDKRLKTPLIDYIKKR